MKVAKDTVVQFHYRLSEADADEIENSRGSEPVAYLHGRGGIIKGLEEAMLDREVGDVFSATIAPEKAYGLRNDASAQRIPIKHLLGVKKPKKGQVVAVQTEQGQRQVTVTKVGKFNVDVDTNHPLAGKTLVFEVEVTDIRAATAEELSHGHAHGVGGHQH